MTIDALDAWWPPTFSPVGLGRTRLAWWMIAVASHSTRCSTVFSTTSSSAREGPELSTSADLSSATITDLLRIRHHALRNFALCSASRPMTPRMHKLLPSS